MGNKDRQNLELLKSRVTETAGLDIISPAYCKTISKLIYDKTRISISETTLKRVYGFALTKFQPSLFTLDALSKYCGYTSWKKFCLQSEQMANEEPVYQTKEYNWNTLKRNANQVTSFTLQALKNRAGIPYAKTIKRAFIDEHFRDFEYSGLTGTVILGPGGYGKTTAICHWIDDKLNDGDNNDIILFFSSTALISVMVSGMDIDTWLQALLGYGPLNNISNLSDENAGKFYLLIDGFDEHKFKREQFEILIRQISDFFSLYQENDNFKVILTLQGCTWCSFRNELEAGNKWHTGLNINNECVNIPLFSFNEVKQLIAKNYPDFNVAITVNIAESFKYPLYAQYYFKKYKDNIAEAFTDRTSEFETNLLFLVNKLYLGKHAVEKVLIVKAIVESMDFKNHSYRANKLKVTDTLKYHGAYKEMLCDGILEQYSDPADYNNDVYIKFVNDHYLTHSISKVLLYDNNDLLDSKLIAKINGYFENSNLKLPVLKYAIIHAVKTGQQNSFERITESKLTVKEKSDLILFLGCLFNNEFTALKGNEALLQYFKQQFSDQLFDYFFGLELISNEYKNTLKTLLKFQLTPRNRIFVITTLAIINVTNLELDELAANIEELDKFNDADFFMLAVNSLSCLKTIYEFFKYGIIRKEALIHLTRLSFNPPKDALNLKNCAANDMMYILGMYTMLVTGNQTKTLRFIRVIQNAYKDTPLELDTTNYAFFVKVLTLEGYYKTGDQQKVNTLYHHMASVYGENTNALTPCMETLMHCLKVKCLLGTDLESSIVNEMNCIKFISEKWGMKFNRLFTLLLLAADEGLAEKDPALIKDIKYDLFKLVQNTGISKEAFFITNSYNPNLKITALVEKGM